MNEQMNEVESFRREKPTMSTQPLSRSEIVQIGRNPETDSMIDYASAGTKIGNGMQHLDESLPVGQRRRSELAFAMMKQGMVELEIWMNARGYKV